MDRYVVTPLDDKGEETVIKSYWAESWVTLLEELAAQHGPMIAQVYERVAGRVALMEAKVCKGAEVGHRFRIKTIGEAMMTHDTPPILARIVEATADYVRRIDRTAEPTADIVSASEPMEDGVKHVTFSGLKELFIKVDGKTKIHIEREE